ncbi:MAG TPA: sensor histidine kinase [Steroidobacteraceae bacterium]
MDRQDQDPAEIEKLVQARTRELSAFSSHLQSFSEQEKSELARKLHDELGGLLTAAKMDLSWLQSRVQGEAIQERLSELGGVLDEAMDLKRRVVEELRPSLLDHFGFPTAVRAYVESTCAKAALSCEVSLEYAGEALPKDTAIALFRVVQAGLSNIICHSRGRNVRLVVRGDDRLCSLTLTDDGQGFDRTEAPLQSSHGLMGMRQRVSALGGNMDVSSVPGKGTTLHVQIPLARPA